MDLADAARRRGADRRRADTPPAERRRRRGSRGRAARWARSRRSAGESSPIPTALCSSHTTSDMIAGSSRRPSSAASSSASAFSRCHSRPAPAPTSHASRRSSPSNAGRASLPAKIVFASASRAFSPPSFRSFYVSTPRRRDHQVLQRRAHLPRHHRQNRGIRLPRTPNPLDPRGAHIHRGYLHAQQRGASLRVRAALRRVVENRGFVQPQLRRLQRNRRLHQPPQQRGQSRGTLPARRPGAPRGGVD